MISFTPFADDKNDVITGLTVHAEDVDSGDNGVVSYSLALPATGISIDKYSGIISINQSRLNKEIFLKVSGFIMLFLTKMINGPIFRYLKMKKFHPEIMESCIRISRGILMFW